MFPELVTRADLEIFLPPINGLTIYMVGDVATIPDPDAPLVVRLHDESYDAELFGSHASTGRLWLVYGIEECVRAAQAGGCGLIVYARQEGNALGEVAKFLVHNARAKSQQGSDVRQREEETERVTGAADVRLYELCADPLLWLGISRIHTFVTSSGAKTRAVQAAGIEIIKTVKLPASLLPPSAIAEANFKEERSKGSFAARAGSNPVSPLFGSNNGPPVPPAPLLEGPASPRRSGAPAHRFISLTSHAAQFSVSPLPVRWGAAEPASRGAVVATLAHPQHRNAIGTHNGPYAVYRAVGIAKQIIDPSRPLDLQSTEHRRRRRAGRRAASLHGLGCEQAPSPSSPSGRTPRGTTRTPSSRSTRGARWCRRPTRRSPPPRALAA